MKIRRAHSRLTKHTHVGRLIRQRIESGQYGSGARMPTELELAHDLDVNPLTVSRALRELVREGLIIRRRGAGTFVTDRRHPPLMPGRHLRLGMLWQRSVIPSRLNGFFQGEISRGVLDAWKLEGEAQWPLGNEAQPTRAVWKEPARGVTVEVLGEAWRSPERHPPLEAVRAGRYDGILSLSIAEEPFLEQLLALGLPTVLVDFPNDRFADRADQVFADPGPAYRAAVRQMIEQGLTRIHFIGCLQSVPKGSAAPIVWREWGLRPDPDTILRQSAWKQAMGEAGLPAGDEMVHQAWFDAAFNQEIFDRMLALPQDQLPQALVCHSAAHAREAEAVFAAKGLKIRSVGAGNEPGPGVIGADPKSMGAAAAQLLLWKIANPERPAMRVGVAMKFAPDGTSGT